jgi:hypothetical protein
MDIHTSSTIQWQGLTVKGATDLLSPLFDAQYAQLARTSTSTSAPTAPTAPSAAIMYALTHLVQAVRALGIPTGMSLPTVPGVVSAFVKAARALPGWKAMAGERAAQAALDLSLLAVLDGGSAKDDEAVRALFAKVPDMDDFKASLPDTLLESLRRTQLTLAPLVQHLAAAAPAPVPRRGVDRSAALLRLGAPALAARAVGVSADVQSVIPLARAGPRYGLLSIVV